MPVTITAEERALTTQLREQLNDIAAKLGQLSAKYDDSNDPEPYALYLAARGAWSAYSELTKIK